MLLLRAILPFTLVPRAIVALDSRRCLSPKFHANTHNHTTCHCPVKPLREREPWPAAIDKATRVRCRLWKAESKVWVIRPNQLFRNLSDDFHRSKFPMAIVWDAAGSKNWWEFSGKAQRPTLRSSCLQSQLWQFVGIMRRFLRLNITSSPGNLWQIVIYCSVMTETETNAKYSKYSERSSFKVWNSFGVFCADNCDGNSVGRIHTLRWRSHEKLRGSDEKSDWESHEILMGIRW